MDQSAAAVSAAGRYAPPVCAAAIAIALAMVPVAMVDGLQGVVYRQFSLVLAAAALASVLAAVVIVPAFAAVIPVRTKPCVSSSESRQALLAPAILYIALAACAVAAWGIGKGLPGEFIPAEDIGEIVVDCKMAEGTSMPVTADVMRSIYRRVRDIGGIEKSTTLLGESIVSGYGENNAKMYLVLKDWAKRDKSMFEIAKEIEKAVVDIPEAQVFTICPPPMQGQGNQGGLTVLVQSMEDADPVRFANEMQKFCAALARSPLADSANCGTVADVPHLRVHVDREKCELMQVPMLSLYTTLQHALGSVYVNDVNLGTQVNRVTVMSDWSARSSADRVGDLYVRSKTGDMVPVGALVTFSEELGVRDCYRCNQYLYATCHVFRGDRGSAADFRGESAARLRPGLERAHLRAVPEQRRHGASHGALRACRVSCADGDVWFARPPVSVPCACRGRDAWRRGASSDDRDFHLALLPVLDTVACSYVLGFCDACGFARRHNGPRLFAASNRHFLPSARAVVWGGRRGQPLDGHHLAWRLRVLCACPRHDWRL